eukprot:TRINITY_DN435_c1_g1_i1.p1 TRINITY_DN435_c1_g1~~TRINITY_DN435_c1_g1_i1.p1  ORF type:complete len:554 (+),score=173.26 TRINITY_DN435_c1_g1_i1:136-1797(+)
MAAGDKDPSSGPSTATWVQYVLHYRGDNERVGEALLQLDEAWEAVPRGALVTWVKKKVLTELATTLPRVEAVQVTIEAPLGTTLSNEVMYANLSTGFVNVFVVAPRPSEVILPQARYPPTLYNSPIPSGPLGSLLSSEPPDKWPGPVSIPIAQPPAFAQASPTALTLESIYLPGVANGASSVHPQFNSSRVVASTGLSVPSSASHILPSKLGPFSAERGGNGTHDIPPGSPLEGGHPNLLGEKRKRQEKWTEHETLTLVTAKAIEELEEGILPEGIRPKPAQDRWQRISDIMKSKGVMDRGWKNCEDKVTNLKKDYGKIREWHSVSSYPRYWELSVTERKTHKLPVNMSEAVFQALQQMEAGRGRFQLRASQKESVGFAPPAQHEGAQAGPGPSPSAEQQQGAVGFRRPQHLQQQQQQTQQPPLLLEASSPQLQQPQLQQLQQMLQQQHQQQQLQIEQQLQQQQQQEQQEQKQQAEHRTGEDGPEGDEVDGEDEDDDDDQEEEEEKEEEEGKKALAPVPIEPQGGDTGAPAASSGVDEALPTPPDSATPPAQV